LLGARDRKSEDAVADTGTIHLNIGNLTLNLCCWYRWWWCNLDF